MNRLKYVEGESLGLKLLAIAFLVASVAGSYWLEERLHVHWAAEGVRQYLSGR